MLVAAEGKGLGFTKRGCPQECDFQKARLDMELVWRNKNDCTKVSSKKKNTRTDWTAGNHRSIQSPHSEMNRENGRSNFSPWVVKKLQTWLTLSCPFMTRSLLRRTLWISPVFAAVPFKTALEHPHCCERPSKRHGWALSRLTLSLLATLNYSTAKQPDHQQQKPIPQPLNDGVTNEGCGCWTSCQSHLG